MCPNYSYHCEACGCVTVEFFRIAERPDGISCPACLEIAEYRIDAPAVTRASYVDGTKRKGWAELREANKLTQEAAVSKRGTANEIRREIRKMGVKIEK